MCTMEKVSLFFSCHCMSMTYRSLAKERPRAEHFSSLPKMGVGALSSVLRLATKERPRHVHSNSMPLKQRISQTIV